MSGRTLSRILMWAGVGIAVVATASLAVDRSPLIFSPFVVKVAVYKLAFIAAAGLLAVGAIIGRRWRESSEMSKPNEELREGTPPMDIRDREERVRRSPDQ